MGGHHKKKAHVKKCRNPKSISKERKLRFCSDRVVADLNLNLSKCSVYDNLQNDFFMPDAQEANKENLVKCVKKLLYDLPYNSTDFFEGIKQFNSMHRNIAKTSTQSDLSQVSEPASAIFDKTMQMPDENYRRHDVTPNKNEDRIYDTTSDTTVNGFFATNISPRIEKGSVHSFCTDQYGCNQIENLDLKKCNQNKNGSRTDRHTVPLENIVKKYPYKINQDQKFRPNHNVETKLCCEAEQKLSNVAHQTNEIINVNQNQCELNAHNSFYMLSNPTTCNAYTHTSIKHISGGCDGFCNMFKMPNCCSRRTNCNQLNNFVPPMFLDQAQLEVTASNATLNNKCVKPQKEIKSRKTKKNEHKCVQTENADCFCTSENAGSCRTSENAGSCRTSEKAGSCRTSENADSCRTVENPGSCRTSENAGSHRTSGNTCSCRTSEKSASCRTSEQLSETEDTNFSCTTDINDNISINSNSADEILPRTVNKPLCQRKFSNIPQLFDKAIKHKRQCSSIHGRGNKTNGFYDRINNECKRETKKSDKSCTCKLLNPIKLCSENVCGNSVPSSYCNKEVCSSECINQNIPPVENKIYNEVNKPSCCSTTSKKKKSARFCGKNAMYGVSYKNNSANLLVSQGHVSTTSLKPCTPCEKTSGYTKRQRGPSREFKSNKCSNGSVRKSSHIDLRKSCKNSEQKSIEKCCDCSKKQRESSREFKSNKSINGNSRKSSHTDLKRSINGNSRKSSHTDLRRSINGNSRKSSHTDLRRSNHSQLYTKTPLQSNRESKSKKSLIESRKGSQIDFRINYLPPLWQENSDHKASVCGKRQTEIIIETKLNKSLNESSRKSSLIDFFRNNSQSQLCHVKSDHHQQSNKNVRCECTKDRSNDCRNDCPILLCCNEKIIEKESFLNTKRGSLNTSIRAEPYKICKCKKSKPCRDDYRSLHNLNNKCITMCAYPSEWKLECKNAEIPTNSKIKIFCCDCNCESDPCKCSQGNASQSKTCVKCSQENDSQSKTSVHQNSNKKCNLYNEEKFNKNDNDLYDVMNHIMPCCKGWKDTDIHGTEAEVQQCEIIACDDRISEHIEDEFNGDHFKFNDIPNPDTVQKDFFVKKSSLHKVEDIHTNMIVKPSMLSVKGNDVCCSNKPEITKNQTKTTSFMNINDYFDDDDSANERFSCIEQKSIPPKQSVTVLSDANDKLEKKSIINIDISYIGPNPPTEDTKLKNLTSNISLKRLKSGMLDPVQYSQPIYENTNHNKLLEDVIIPWRENYKIYTGIVKPGKKAKHVNNKRSSSRLRTTDLKSHLTSQEYVKNVLPLKHYQNKFNNSSSTSSITSYSNHQKHTYKPTKKMSTYSQNIRKKKRYYLIETSDFDLETSNLGKVQKEEDEKSNKSESSIKINKNLSSASVKARTKTKSVSRNHSTNKKSLNKEINPEIQDKKKIRHCEREINNKFNISPTTSENSINFNYKKKQDHHNKQKKKKNASTFKITPTEYNKTKIIDDLPSTNRKNNKNLDINTILVRSLERILDTERKNRHSTRFDSPESIKSVESVKSNKYKNQCKKDNIVETNIKHNRSSNKSTKSVETLGSDKPDENSQKLKTTKIEEKQSKSYTPIESENLTKSDIENKKLANAASWAVHNVNRIPNNKKLHRRKLNDNISKLNIRRKKESKIKLTRKSKKSFCSISTQSGVSLISIIKVESQSNLNNGQSNQKSILKTKNNPDYYNSNLKSYPEVSSKDFQQFVEQVNNCTTSNMDARTLSDDTIDLKSFVKTEKMNDSKLSPAKNHLQNFNTFTTSKHDDETTYSKQNEDIKSNVSEEGPFWIFNPFLAAPPATQYQSFLNTKSFHGSLNQQNGESMYCTSDEGVYKNLEVPLTLTEYLVNQKEATYREEIKMSPKLINKSGANISQSISQYTSVSKDEIDVNRFNKPEKVQVNDSTYGTKIANGGQIFECMDYSASYNIAKTIPNEYVDMKVKTDVRMRESSKSLNKPCHLEQTKSFFKGLEIKPIMMEQNKMNLHKDVENSSHRQTIPLNKTIYSVGEKPQVPCTYQDVGTYSIISPRNRNTNYNQITQQNQVGTQDNIRNYQNPEELYFNLTNTSIHSPRYIDSYQNSSRLTSQKSQIKCSDQISSLNNHKAALHNQNNLEVMSDKIMTQQNQQQNYNNFFNENASIPHNRPIYPKLNQHQHVPRYQSNQIRFSDEVLYFQSETSTNEHHTLENESRQKEADPYQVIPTKHEAPIITDYKNDQNMRNDKEYQYRQDKHDEIKNTSGFQSSMRPEAISEARVWNRNETLEQKYYTAPSEIKSIPTDDKSFIDHLVMHPKFQSKQEVNNPQLVLERYVSNDNQLFCRETHQNQDVQEIQKSRVNNVSESGKIYLDNTKHSVSNDKEYQHYRISTDKLKNSSMDVGDESFYKNDIKPKASGEITQWNQNEIIQKKQEKYPVFSYDYLTTNHKFVSINQDINRHQNLLERSISRENKAFSDNVQTVQHSVVSEKKIDDLVKPDNSLNEKVNRSRYMLETSGPREKQCYHDTKTGQHKYNTISVDKMQVPSNNHLVTNSKYDVPSQEMHRHQNILERSFLIENSSSQSIQKDQCRCHTTKMYEEDDNSSPQNIQKDQCRCHTTKMYEEDDNQCRCQTAATDRTDETFNDDYSLSPKYNGTSQETNKHQNILQESGSEINESNLQESKEKQLTYYTIPVIENHMAYDDNLVANPKYESPSRDVNNFQIAPKKSFTIDSKSYFQDIQNEQLKFSTDMKNSTYNDNLLWNQISRQERSNQEINRHQNILQRSVSRDSKIVPSPIQKSYKSYPANFPGEKCPSCKNITARAVSGDNKSFIVDHNRPIQIEQRKFQEKYQPQLKNFNKTAKTCQPHEVKRKPTPECNEYHDSHTLKKVKSVKKMTSHHSNIQTKSSLEKKQQLYPLKITGTHSSRNKINFEKLNKSNYNSKNTNKNQGPRHTPTKFQTKVPQLPVNKNNIEQRKFITTAVPETSTSNHVSHCSHRKLCGECRKEAAMHFLLKRELFVDTDNGSEKSSSVTVLYESKSKLSQGSIESYDSTDDLMNKKTFNFVQSKSTPIKNKLTKNMASTFGYGK